MSEFVFTAHCTANAGAIIFVVRNGDSDAADASLSTSLPPSFLPVGTQLRMNFGSGGAELLGTVVQNAFAPHVCGEHALEGMWVRLHTQVEAGAPLPVTLEKRGISLAWITLSDKGARGDRHDESGPLVQELVTQACDVGFSRGFMIPDDLHGIQSLLTDCALRQCYDLIVTTGGTGVAPRDVTPEATLRVIEKRLQGMEQAMMATSLSKTPHAVVSRAVAGILGQSIIINCPGSKKAVTENLSAVLPALPHTIAKLQGDPADCGV